MTSPRLIQVPSPRHLITALTPRAQDDMGNRRLDVQASVTKKDSSAAKIKSS